MRLVTVRRLTMLLAVTASITAGCHSADVEARQRTRFGAATPELDVLSALVGQFSVKGESMDAAGGQLVPNYTGMHQGRWVLQGHAVEMATLGTGAADGYEAFAIVSYDPLLDEYQAVSATSNGPGLSVRSRGTFDRAKSALSFEREHKDNRGNPVHLRFINRFQEDGSFTLEVHSLLEEETLRSRYVHRPLP